MRLSRWKKFAPHLIIATALIATVVPTLGAHLLNELTPYLNLTDVTAKPEAVELESMKIVDKKYEKHTVEYLISSSSTEITVKNKIWEIDGIYLKSQYGTKGATNYFNSLVLINDETIDLSRAPLPKHTYQNEHLSSEFVVYNDKDTYNITQSEDDAWNRPDPIPRTNYTSQTLLLGGSSDDINTTMRRVGLRWNLMIPEGATISSAYIQLTFFDNSSNYDRFIGEIYGFKDSSTPDFSDTSENLWNRARTSETQNWGFYYYNDNQTIQSSDIGSILQEVVDTPSWEGNDEFGLIIRPESYVDPNEMIEFWSYDGAIATGKPEYAPKLIIKWIAPPASDYSKSDFDNPNIRIEREINTTYVKHPIESVIGVWNTSDHRFENLYNQTDGDSFSGDIITLTVRTPYETGTDVWINYFSGEIPVVVEYTIREWTEITWALGLKVNNRGDDTIIFPRANLTLNFLEDNLAKGWISREYEIKGHESKTVKAYLVMKNDRFFDTFLTALLLGEPLDLTLGMEAYILAEGRNDEPLVPIVYSVDMDFTMPALKRGPAPFIHSITRAPVSANQPVKICVSGSDEGTGISNRTYIYYSIDGGTSWENALLTGGEWWNEYAGIEFYYWYDSEKGDKYRYPIHSTIEPELYEGEIPSFPAGTEVLFKIYLEDYAANIDHIDKGNWIWSQTYSYIVPGSGKLPEFTVEFKKSTEEPFSKKLMKYLELNGFIQNYYLKSRGINTNLYVTELLPELAAFLYEKNVDAAYAIQMTLLDMERAREIMADSGMAIGYMLDLLGISFKDLFAYIVDNIFLPTKQETDLVDIAKDRFEEIRLINDIEVSGASGWITEPSGTIATSSHGLIIPYSNEPIGQQSLKWTVSAPANLSYNPGVLIDLSKNDLISFYLDYDNYSSLNENLSVTLIDDNGREMTSKQIYFEETTFETWQEITLPLARFTKDIGFNLGAIDQINFTYCGTEDVDIHIDYIMAYSMESYSLHQYITRDLRFKAKHTAFFLPSIGSFLQIYQGTGYGTYPPLPDNTKDPIIPDFDIVRVGENPSYSRYTSGWYFLNLVATNGTFEYPYGPDPNHHICGAATFLQYAGFPNGYKKLCELFGVEFDEFDEEPFTKKEIYPYTQTLATLMVYIPLGAVAALAIVLRVRQHRYKTKVKKIRNKYTKIGKR